MTRDFNKKRKPLFHIVRRSGMPWWEALLIRLGGILLGIIVICILFQATTVEKNPFAIVGAIFNGCFGTARRTWLLFRDTALLLLVSLALVPSFKMKFWNLGGNGQILVGALVAVMCMFYMGKAGVPNWAIILIEIPSSILAGAIWAAIPAIFKAFFNTNESLFTLMMNYIAEGLVAVFLNSAVANGSGTMDILSTGALVNIGNPYVLTIIIAVVVFALVTVYLRFTKHGYELEVVGESPNTARYIGINTKKVIIRTIVLSGAICGLVGLLLGAGINHSIATNSHDGLGFTAIMAAWLAHLNPGAMAGTSFLISFLDRGVAQAQTAYGVTNDSVSSIALGFVYFAILAAEFFVTYRVVFSSAFHLKKKKATAMEKGDEK